MLRKIVAGACLASSSLVGAQETPKVGHETHDATMLWSYLEATGAYYKIDRREGGEMPGSQIVTVWVTADHSKDRTVQYRRSVRRMAFDCRGSYQVTSFRSFMPDGSVHLEWENLNRPAPVLTGTLAGSIEAVICLEPAKG